MEDEKFQTKIGNMKLRLTNRKHENMGERKKNEEEEAEVKKRTTKLKQNFRSTVI